MIHLFQILAIIFLSSVGLAAQNFDSLIQKAWTNNQQLKAKDFDIQSATAIYQVSKAMYGPQVNFGIQYTLATGGRSIDLPIGELLNPVYGTLNQLTQSNQFRNIENTAIQFLPNNFYDAKIHITQPIYYPDLTINKQLKLETITLIELEKNAFKRVISNDVMQAYFQYKMANDAIEIYYAADTLLIEAQRATQSMIKNGIAPPLALSRIENQKANIETQIIEGQNQAKNAERLLGFTLSSTDITSIPNIVLPELPDTFTISANEREEIAQLNQGIKMTALGIKKESQFYKPNIGVGLDLGSQAFNFGFEPYGLLGINFSVNLYDHKQHKYRQSAYKADIMVAESRRTHISNQFDLVSDIAYNNLTSAVRQATTIKPRIAIAHKVYFDALRRYKEGSGQYLEIIDAQSQVIQIETQFALSKLKAWQKWADYVYATASYPIQ
jgi:outer membrane protein TolC